MKDFLADLFLNRQIQSLNITKKQEA